ncbi:MAG: alpha/beta fold hydrolase [Spongiibacteraceae bacterium]
MYRDIAPAELFARYGDGGHRITLDEQSMLYRSDNRQAAKTPLVLIHSHYFDSLMWRPLIAELGDELPIISYDLSSHGLTGPERNGDYSMARDVEILQQLLAHLGLERVALLGSSYGGNVAFHYAAQYPEQVASLVLINSGGLKREQSARRNAAGIPDWFYKVFYFVPTGAYRQFIEWMVFDPAVVTEELVARFHHMFRGAGNRRAELKRMASFDVGAPAAVLANVKAPTLILWGRENPQLPVVQASKFLTMLPAAASAELRIIDQAGHLLPWEKPAETAAELKRFWEAL